jgi:hypothetical protein
LVGTPAEHLVKMTVPGGHLSLFLGSNVLYGAWCDIVRWLRHDLNGPQIGRP